MVDISQLVAGRECHRQALSTTSNNIANVNTPGYSRRALDRRAFRARGCFQLRHGCANEAVARAYDEFLERSLRDAKSDLAVHEPVIKYANRVIDIMATEAPALPMQWKIFSMPRSSWYRPRSNALRATS